MTDAACHRRGTQARWGLAFALALGLGPAACSNEPGPSGAGEEDSSTTDSSIEDDGVVDGGSDDGETSVDEDDVEVEFLEPVPHLVRISMALRGARPSLADIERVEDDPAAVEELVDEYLAAPQLGTVMRDLHNEALLVHMEVPLPRVAPLEGRFDRSIGDSVMQTALRLAEHVVVEDRPYTELVTADYWVVDEIAASVYGTTFDPGGPDWQAVPYPDERPAAGVLADNATYLRHQSAGANYNRGRANAISRALLCQDFLVQDIVVDGGLDLSDPETVANAVQKLDACTGCHQSLDPLSSHFFPLVAEPDPEQYFEDQLQQAMNSGEEYTPSYPIPSLYLPQFEDAWEITNGRAPAYFGQPTEDLADLGQAIADDPRFSLCTAKRFYAYFNQTRVEDVPLERAAELQTVLVDSGFDAKDLIRAVVLGDDFRVAHALDEQTAEEVHGYRKARPYQLALLYEDLTGFRWDIDIGLLDPAAGQGVISLPNNSFYGFEVLGGGIDSAFVLEPAQTVNATSSLVLQAFAAEAASFVVEQDAAAEPGDRRLLSEPLSTDETAVKQQLTELYLRLYAQRVELDDPAIEEIYAVFSGSLMRSGDPQHAWKTTLTALLQDLSIIYY